MKPVKMTILFSYDSGRIIDDVEVGEVYDAVVIGNYYPGDDGIRWGHPDGWEEEVGHDFEVISAKEVGSNRDIEISDEAYNKLIDLAWERFHHR